MSPSRQEDLPSRIRSTWVGLLVLASFGILSLFVVLLSDADLPGEDAVTATRAKVRAEGAEQLLAAQRELVETAAVVDEAAGTVRLPAETAAQLVLPTLQAKPAAATHTVVPGSPTQIQQSSQPAAEPEPEAEPQSEPEPESELEAADKPAVAEPAKPEAASGDGAPAPDSAN